MVKCLSQLYQCTTRQEYHLGDVFFFLNRKHILNAILQLIIHNSFVVTEADSPNELTENRHVVLPHAVCI